MERSELPLVTIAMPVKNRCWVLPYVLKSIEEQDYPKNRIKIVFIDNYSNDGTYELLYSWARSKKHEYYDIILTRSEGNIPHLRNMCLRFAEGKYILFWDSDIIAPLCALRTLVTFAEDREDAGAITVIYKCEDLEYIPAIKAINCTNVRFEKVDGVGLGFTLIPLKVFEFIGFFNEFFDVGEDTWFSYALKEKTKLKHYRARLEVLHARHRDQIIPRANQSMARWLSFCFNRRAEAYLQSFKSLPTHLKLRVFYWLLLPFITGLSLYSLISSTMIVYKIFYTLLISAYLAVSMIPLIREHGIEKGVKQWFYFNMPTGLAISYGVFFKFIKRLVRE